MDNACVTVRGEVVLTTCDLFLRMPMKGNDLILKITDQRSKNKESAKHTTSDVRQH